MNKSLAIICLILLASFGVLFYISQQKPPTLPEEDLTLQYNQEQLGAQTQTSPTMNTQPTQAPQISVDPATLPTKATIKTEKGDITMELYPEEAPLTVNNFAEKAKNGFYNNLTFHRVEDWVVQGGDPKGTGTGGGNMPTEFNDLPYKVGSVGVARRNDPKIQNDSQFFFTKTDAEWLNNQYTNFGLVTEGMDIVNSLEIGDKIVEITVE